MKKDYTHIAVVLDRSGSIEAIRDDAIGGFNQFLKDQQDVTGEATMTLTQFDDVYEVVHQWRPLGEVPPLNTQTYVPRNMTALLDAMGRTIVSVGSMLEAMNEEGQPEKVVFVVLTDGLENASQEFTKRRVAEMVRHQADVYNWQFVFLGANMDAIKEGASLGVATASSMTYDPQNVKAVYASTSDNVAAYRTDKKRDVTFSDEDREKAKS